MEEYSEMFDISLLTREDYQIVNCKVNELTAKYIQQINCKQNSMFQEIVSNKKLLKILNSLQKQDMPFDKPNPNSSILSIFSNNQFKKDASKKENDDQNSIESEALEDTLNLEKTNAFLKQFIKHDSDLNLFEVVPKRSSIKSNRSSTNEDDFIIEMKFSKSLKEKLSKKFNGIKNILLGFLVIGRKCSLEKRFGSCSKVYAYICVSDKF